jgi:protein-S-isoprenylcysteine O-methyltransferase Ste14
MVTQWLRAGRQTKYYDLLAAVPLIVWYAFCAARIVPTVTQQIALIKLFVQTDPSALPASLLLRTLAHVTTLIFFAVLIVMFAVRHTPLRTAPSLYANCAAIAGTFLSVGIVLLPPQELSSALYLVSLAFIVVGTVFAIWASLVLGRSISILPQARRLVTSGPYCLVRHPLYLGEIVAIVGVILQHFSIWALLLAGLQFAFQLQRMKNEERVLFQVFPEYGAYMARTARLVPRVY